MFNIIIRVLIIYIFVIIVMRLMGKRQIGEMEPFELVITLIIADLATVPMAESTIPIWHGIIPLLTIVVIHYLLSVFTLKSSKLRNLISGKPVVVITPDGIDIKQLNKLNISIEELTESLRNLEYYNLDDINYAILERNGKLSVIPKTQSLPPTQKDMAIKNPETSLGYCLIENGKVIKENLTTLNLNMEWLLRMIEHYILCTISDILVLYCTEDGECYTQKFDDKPFTFKAVIE